MATPTKRTVAWTRMEDGTREDYEYLGAVFEAHARATLVDNLLGMLALMKGPTLGYRVDRHEHSLQSASRALRSGESTEMVVAALLHDIGDVFAPANHSRAAAELLAPYVDERTTWIVRHHGVFQGYYYFHHVGADRDARDRWLGHPHYDACAAFCAEYDQNCFDPSYPTLPIDEFVPLLREVFARPPRFGDDELDD